MQRWYRYRGIVSRGQGVGVQPNEELRRFCWPGVLPSGQSLVFNWALGLLSYLGCEQGRGVIVWQEHFTEGEKRVLVPLLEAFPEYCPHEVLFAHLYHGTVTQTQVAHCHEHLQAATKAGIWAQEMRGVRCMLSRMRRKLRPFGMEISSLMGTGYLLLIERSLLVESA